MPNPDDFVGVILAAGKGTRMFPFTARWPKPILPIMGKPLLQHQIEMLNSVGIRQIFVVIGHLGYEVVRALGNGEEFGVNLEYVEQTETLGIAHAVGRLESRVRKPFLLCLGDIFFVSNKLHSMLALFGKKNTKAVLASKLEENPEMIRRNFAIIPTADGRVKQVIEKPRYIRNKLKGCGIYLFGLEIFDAIRRTPRTAMRDEYEITEAIQIMINDGHRVVHAQIIEEDLNLTNPEDLLMINMLELQNLKLRNYFVADGSDNSKIKGVESCVIGGRVTLQKPVYLQNCVIFDDVVIPKGAKLKNAIITPEAVIQCNPES
ncbi:MAG TPA: sugar phosphate nucleotidyltransferase [Acidobacteriota bacterium]|nr:sugar phosphate nucleotidyltransferase [Acidobacteriota bacterium]